MHQDKAVPENRYRGTTLDNFLEGEGVLAEFQARAVKEVAAWQSADAETDAKERPDDVR